MNLFTGFVIAVLVMLSIILTAAVLFPNITDREIFGILMAGSSIGLAAVIAARFLKTEKEPCEPPIISETRIAWRMPPLNELPPAKLTLLNRIWLVILRSYLVIAAGLVLVRIVELAVGSA
jgi:hypothetical protein